jgi:preprotein translocase subunit SecD
MVAFQGTDCSALTPANVIAAPVDKPLIACDQDGSVKYLLGPMEVSGAWISSASAESKPDGSGWVVNITYDSVGTRHLASLTTRITSQAAPLNQVAFMIDGYVLTAPIVARPITTGTFYFEGAFTEQSAKTLADRLSR